MRSPLLFLLVSIPLAAQTERFSFGVTGGVPFGRMTSRVPFGPDESRRYTAGLNAEAYLNDHVSLNFNPLYKRTGARFGLVPGSRLIIDPAAPLLENTGRV